MKTLSNVSTCRLGHDMDDIKKQRSWRVGQFKPRGRKRDGG